MSSFLHAYDALSSTSPRSEVASVFQSLIDAYPSQIDPATRKTLVQTILDDLTKCSSGNGKKGRLTAKDAFPALLATKILGKDPAGSEVIATSANLSTLLALSRFFKDDADASSEALRCIANAMLLISHARETFIQSDVGGGDAAVELLEKTTNAERIFLASRILFLSTVSMASANFIRALVETKPPGHPGNIIEIIGTKLDILSRNIQTSAKLSREAMTDLLKFTFNLLLHYPKIANDSEEITNRSEDEAKIMGDSWNERLDGILPPLLRAFNALPPSFPSPLVPPMTHIIHSLITIPVTPSLHSKWFQSTSRSSSPRSPKSRESSLGSPPRSASGSASGSPTLGPSKDKSSAFDRAMSKLTVGRRSLSLSRSTSPNRPALVDVLLRAYDLLDVSFSHYLPGNIDPDDGSVREKCRAEGNANLDDVLVPLVLLVNKLCTADEGSRARMREWVLPPDLDRTTPLEGRADFLGRCLRLLACVHHARLKSATGEMLYSICDFDASLLASYVGYGNVAGFLFHKGITGQPSRPSNAPVPQMTPSGVPINPITGIVEEESPEIEMTDEEKEREAEKLFVLFDRLEKSGALQPNQNPIRKAVQEGRLG
ncbi:guanine nucleotide exchange factor [Rhodofomes roseus]|uniref:Guanine nucleotide exchange factor n=1 Tax=Rhodofomes roseus TaxID=34475 RepID=A0ABQ8KWP6_9APHY|nr:guanine nucleotide exchange factor [Rhodofomes roseus]KAH9843641.1 guanine nucleotide exchange factor [Rhodofomes roseus]